MRGGAPPPPDLAPPAAAPWMWVVRERGRRLRVALLLPPAGDGASALVVARYVGGVLWEREVVDAEGQEEGAGATLLVDGDTPWFAAPPASPCVDARQALGGTLLRARLAATLSRSAIARSLAAHLRGWSGRIPLRAPTATSSRAPSPTRACATSSPR